MTGTSGRLTSISFQFLTSARPACYHYKRPRSVVMNLANPFHPRDEERRQLLIQMAKRQNKRCLYCKKNVYYSQRHAQFTRFNQATFEHLIPQSAGGCGCETNLAVACMRCNNARGHLPVALFLRILRKLFENEAIRRHWHEDTTAARTLLQPVVVLFSRMNAHRVVPPTLTWPSSPR